MSERFYSSLPIHDDFAVIADPATFTPVPAEWYIALSDVRRSTKAIQEGRYKAVNVVGASTIVALLNVASPLEIPFLFGGDGAAVLLPPSLVEPAKAALLATRKIARSQFDLDLRVGIVPVSAVVEAGHAIRIARVRISQNYAQALLNGGGLAYAEWLLKEPAQQHLYSVEERAIEPVADFTGLECRWQDIPSPHGETVSLLVATGPGTLQNQAVYRQLLAKITEIYGSDAEHHPLRLANLRLTYDPRELAGERRLRAKPTRLDQLGYLLKLWTQATLLRLALRFNWRIGGVDWHRYLDILLETADYKKYDDMLRMVISGTETQRHALADYLEVQYRKGHLVYGMHVSDRAVMTCLVFEREGRHVHFIDGADGGYALAALALKERQRALETAPSGPVAS